MTLRGRAECLGDIVAFTAALLADRRFTFGPHIERMTHERTDVVTREYIVTIEFGASLVWDADTRRALSACLGRVSNGHVLRQSLKHSRDYNGKRDSTLLASDDDR